VKRWSYWCVTDERFVLALTLADLGYLGLASLWYLDFQTGRTRSSTALRRRMDLSIFDGPRLGIAFIDEPGGTRLRVRARGLDVDLVAARQPHLTVRVREVVTNKHVARPTAGTVAVDGRVLAVDGAFATLDATEGTWPRRTVWSWAVAQGVRDGRRVGVNLGAQWTDGSGATENALYVDGGVRPLAFDVAFTRWGVTGPGVDLRLEPLHERKLRVPVLAATTVAFGRWTGAVEGVRFDGLYGWAEDVRFRW